MKKLVLACLAAALVVPTVALAQNSPVRVGGNTAPPERIKYVQPAYPAEAAAARVSGVVIAEITVGPDGAVKEAHILRSIALLDQAALNAIKQWRYTPTTLNGQPVPVIMTVTVKFTPDSSPVSRTATPGTGAQPVVSFSASPNEPPTLNGREVLRIGGEIKAPERVKYVAPAYPQEAKAALVQGIVIIEAIVDENGDVVQAKVLRSISLLDDAALDAVMQWKYTPTTLNGAPTPVLMTVTVNFTLQ